LANRIGRLAYRMGDYTYLDPRLRAAHAACLTKVPIRFVVPLSSQDDDGFALPLSEMPQCVLRQTDHQYFKLPVMVFRASRREAQHEALLAHTLRYQPVTPHDGCVTVRRRGTFCLRRRWYHVECHATWL
jgi:hypothetical protein